MPEHFFDIFAPKTEIHSGGKEFQFDPRTGELLKYIADDHDAEDMNYLSHCPLCGAKTAFGKCTACGYKQDTAELEQMTDLLDTDPDNYPGAPRKAIVIRKSINEVPMLPEDAEPPEEPPKDLYELIARKADSVLKDALYSLGDRPSGLLAGLVILSMIVPPLVNIIASVLLITFSFSKKKSIIISAALMTALTLIKLFFGLW